MRRLEVWFRWGRHVGTFHAGLVQSTTQLSGGVMNSNPAMLLALHVKAERGGGKH